MLRVVSLLPFCAHSQLPDVPPLCLGILPQVFLSVLSAFPAGTDAETPQQPFFGPGTKDTNNQREKDGEML